MLILKNTSKSTEIFRALTVCWVNIANLGALVVEYTNNANWNFSDTGSAKSRSAQCKYKWNRLLLAFANYALQSFIQTTCIIKHNQTPGINMAASV